MWNSPPSCCSSSMEESIPSSATPVRSRPWLAWKDGDSLGEEAVHDLSEGYRFLRRLENSLRIAATDGVSTISRDLKHLRKLILLLGEPRAPYCQSPEAFTDYYLATTGRVRGHYREIVARLGGD